jgi:hypothetical protein
MIAELAMGDLSYRQIGQKYGKTENNVQQFAWYYKKEIAEERARFYAEPRLRCDGEKQYRVKVLKEIIEKMNERLVEFAEVCNRLDLRFLEDQAVWHNYHAAFCRYRELQADLIRQIKEELDPQTRSARDEVEVEVDQPFDPVCPRCEEPISEVATA